MQPNAEPEKSSTHLAYKKFLSNLRQDLQKSLNCQNTSKKSENKSEGRKSSSKLSSHTMSAADIVISKEALLQGRKPSGTSTKGGSGWCLKPTTINHFTGKKLRRKSGDTRFSHFLDITDLPQRSSQTPRH